MRARLVRREVRIGDVPIGYQEAGEGEPLVLLHGLSGSTLWWGRNVQALAPRHHLYLVDLPGFGALRRLRKQFALATATRWVLQWMDAVGIERAHLLGHSMGGLISIRIAAAYPERVNQLVLAAPAGLPGVSSLLGEIRPLVTALRYTTPTFLPILAYDALRAGPTTLLRASMDILGSDVRADLGSIAAPTLLIWGDRDTLVPPSGGPVLRQAIPDSRLLMVRGAGHVVMYDRHRVFNDAVLRFLRGDVVGH